ncbi:MAG: hypothetical protein MI757_16270 [Pirellulales bacterium]|nr:hypothetical protein [Pirellulales bacterium]
MFHSSHQRHVEQRGQAARPDFGSSPQIIFRPRLSWIEVEQLDVDILRDAVYFIDLPAAAQRQLEPRARHPCLARIVMSLKPSP